MKQGKLTENCLKRSVLRKIGTYREEMQKGAALGQDCAFFSWKEESLVTTTQTVALPVKDAGRLAVYAADNNLAASGAQTIGISLALTLPETLEEKELQELMRGIDDTCKELSIQISGGHTEISRRVSTPVISVTAFGYLKQKRVYECPSKEYDIVMSKFAAVEGTAVLLETKREKLHKSYAQSFLSGAAECAEYLSVREEAAIAVKSGVYAMHDLHQGGIFGALWELSRQIGVGLHVDLKKIPILQETVEICECLEVNPYQLYPVERFSWLRQTERHWSGSLRSMEFRRPVSVQPMQAMTRLSAMRKRFVSWINRDRMKYTGCLNKKIIRKTIRNSGGFEK